MDWKTCIDEGNSVKITPNIKRAEFLARHAENTLKAVKKIKLDNDNASVFFANYYDAFLEMLHAVMYVKGYKVANHYCLGYYLRDVLGEDEAFRTFDKARKIRNSIIYYGEIFDTNIINDLTSRIVLVVRKLKVQIK